MPIEWNKVTWYSKLVAVILALLIWGIGIYIGNTYQKNLSPSPVSVTTSENTPSQNSSENNICNLEKEKILKFIENFETLQKERKAIEVLKLFTPAKRTQDIKAQDFLTGADAGSPRLYSNGQTNFNLISYSAPPYISPVYSYAPEEGCSASFNENRSYYPQGAGGEQGKSQSYPVTLVMLRNAQKEWRIDYYLNADDPLNKFSGWGSVIEERVVYKNDKYGFKLNLPSAYKGFKAIEKFYDSPLSGNKEAYFEFQIDSGDDSWRDFTIFSIGVYEKKWWEDNIVVQNGSAWLKGVEHDLGTNYGLYLGKNDRYEFTYSMGQDCPGYFACALRTEVSQGLYYNFEAL